MNRSQFLRKLKVYCRENRKSFEWHPGEGKGSHGTVYVDGVKTIVKDGELTQVFIQVLLKQLGLDKGVF